MGKRKPTFYDQLMVIPGLLMVPFLLGKGAYDVGKSVGGKLRPGSSKGKKGGRKKGKGILRSLMPSKKKAGAGPVKCSAIQRACRYPSAFSAAPFGQADQRQAGQRPGSNSDQNERASGMIEVLGWTLAGMAIYAGAIGLWIVFKFVLGVVHGVLGRDDG